MMADDNLSLFTEGLMSTVFVAEDAEGDRWAGTRYWMVREPEVLNPSGEQLTKALSLATREHTLTAARGTNGVRLERAPFGVTYRVFDRDDGATILMNDAYVGTVESFLSPAPPASYELHQGVNPLGPVSFVVNGVLAAIVAPVREEGAA